MRVSDSLPLETSTPEGWAEFLAGLTHGPEITQLRTYIVTFSEVQEICGSRALGCYGRDEMVAPGELVADISPEEVVRHEYGHHIANHRSERTVDGHRLGPEAVGERRERLRERLAPRGVSRRRGIELCAQSRARRGPRSTGSWTSARPASRRRPGRSSPRASIPNEAALQAAEQDVLQPWTAPSTRVARGSSARRPQRSGGYRSRRRSTASSGSAPRCRATATYEVALVAADRRTVVRRAQWVGPARQAAGQLDLRPALALRPRHAGRCARACSRLGDDAVIRVAGRRRRARGDAPRDGRERDHGAR